MLAAVLVAAAMAAGPPAHPARGATQDETARLLKQVQDLVASGLADSALALLHPQVLAGPDDGRLERAVVTAALDGGIPWIGVRVIEDCIPLRPSDINLHTALGDLELGRQRPDVAVRHFQRALIIDNISPASVGGFARARARQGTDIAPAIEYFDAVAQQKPGTPEPRYGKAVLLSEAGRLEESMTEFRWAIGLDSKNWYYERDYARALARMGNTAGAVEHFEKAKRLLEDAGDPMTAAQVESELRAARKN